MQLAKPHLLVLDTSTLGILSKHYHSPDATLRRKARGFVEGLQDSGVYVALTLTHICELLRHENIDQVRNRRHFLERLPLMAWIRPIDRNWFPGTVLDVLASELKAFASSHEGWESIVTAVREELWETGTGAEIIGGNDHIWSEIEDYSKRGIQSEKLTASIGKTDPGGISHLTIAELRALPLRPKHEWDRYFAEFGADLVRQLSRAGDHHLNANEVGWDFATDSYERVKSIADAGGDLETRLLEAFDVPPELVQPQMTIAEVGELAVYIAQLKLFAKRLSPSLRVTARDVPIDALPSYVVSRRLTERQRTADRVSGSDVGDVHIAMLSPYADAVQVDKRTFHHLTSVKTADPRLGALLGQICKASDYTEILHQLEVARL